MRKTLLTLLGATATTTALIGGKFVTTPASAHHAAEKPSAHKSVTSTGEPRASRTPSPTPSPSPSRTPSPAPSKTTAPPTSTSRTPTPASPSPTSEPSSSPEPSLSLTPSPTSECEVFGDNPVQIGEDGGDGVVSVDVTVCDHVVKEIGGGVMFSNYEPENEQAIVKLNELALDYYDVDISLITVAGATATSKAYQDSLRLSLAAANIQVPN